MQLRARIGKIKLSMATIHHLVTEGEWAAAQAAGEYRPSSLTHEGFIHASYRDQTVAVANALDALRSRDDLVCLVIDTERVGAPVQEDLVEFPAGVESRHPHVYGPLNLDAVVEVVPFPRGGDGTFSLPKDL